MPDEPERSDYTGDLSDLSQDISALRRAAGWFLLVVVLAILAALAATGRQVKHQMPPVVIEAPAGNSSDVSEVTPPEDKLDNIDKVDRPAAPVADAANTDGDGLRIPTFVQPDLTPAPRRKPASHHPHSRPQRHGRGNPGCGGEAPAGFFCATARAAGLIQ
jgi:hypothetical protein